METLDSLRGNETLHDLPELIHLHPPGVAHLGFSFGERANGTRAGEMIPSAQDGLPRSTGGSIETLAADICDEYLLSEGNSTQSMNSELSRVGVEREFCIWGARMVEPRGLQADSRVTSKTK